MKMRKDITQEYIIEAIDYSPETGDVFWKNRPIHHFSCSLDMKVWNKKYAGKIAGYINEQGYRTVCINRNDYLVHRLAFVIMKGKWPKGRMDHRDTNRQNNKWENLREATDSQNCCNKNIQRNNTSGYIGVAQWKHKWQAYVNVGKKRVWNKLFDTPEEAAYWRNYTAEYYHKEFARVA